MMTIRNDQDVFEMLDYLALCLRTNLFENDFKEAFIYFSTESLGWSDEYAVYQANRAFNSVKRIGLVETFQEYIVDTDYCKALVFAINSERFYKEK